MDLKKFKDFSKEKNKKTIVISVILLVILIGGILLYRSYAYYKEEKTFNVLQGVIPDFTKSSYLNEYLIKKSKTDTSIEQISHVATEQTPSLTDYRYVGSNPNNYVYFGCNDNCTEDNLYRIIGVIPTQSSENSEYENRVKLIKASNYEGTTGIEAGTSTTPSGKGYRWTTTGHNNKWESSSLKEILNSEYYNGLGDYHKFIAPAKWYLGAPNNSSYTTYTPDQFYNIERSTTKGYSNGLTSYVNNIGLMYPSDYGYSIGIDYQTKSIYSNRAEYISNSWLYQLERKYEEWTISPESIYHTDANLVSVWTVRYDGYMNHRLSSYATYIDGARPTFYLKADVLKTGGNGTISDPYRISIEEKKLNDYIIEKSELEEEIVKINHEATDQTPALTDYRYTGKNPNNYVYFGCEENCTEENLYRIIGVVPTQSSEDGEYENRVKLIKASNWVGSTATSTDYTIEKKGYMWTKRKDNRWALSTLNATLNNEYYNSLGEFKNYIEPAKWYLGAPNVNSATKYSLEGFYLSERKNTPGYSKGETSFVGNISLMYPSDYGYSLADATSSHILYEHKEEYKENAWLYILPVGESYEWTITPDAANIRAWSIYSAGSLYADDVTSNANYYGIRPTFYLKENILYNYGNGTKENPFRLAI